VISWSLERRLSLRERVLLKLHLWVCVWCVSYLEHLLIMRISLRHETAKTSEVNLPPGPGLSTEARERIRSSITKEEY
jgi:hypothetical protein